jgi:hypothetical protein
MADSKSPLDQLIDAFVFAPLGLLRELQRSAPRLADEARAEFDQQINNARVIGQFAVKQGRAEVEKRLGVGTKPSPVAPRVAPAAQLSPAPAADASLGAASVGADELAIADYDLLAAAQLLPLLADLNADELAAVESYELGHRRRKTVLGRIGQLRS